MNTINTTAKLFLLLGSVNAILAVILGAFGAHALKARLTEELLTIYQTGSDYHFYHALGMILIGIIAVQFPVNVWLKSSGWLMLAGMAIFCGSLYLLSILNFRWLGMITPIGGLCFILAWASLCVAVIKQ